MPPVGSFTRETAIRDVLTAHPGSASVFERFGLPCGCCIGADMETLASVADMHEVDVDELIAALNAQAPSAEQGGRP